MTFPRWDLPLPNYEKDIQEIVRIYRNAILEVIVILGDLSTYGREKTISREQMMTVLARLSAMLGDVDAQAEIWVKEKIREAFTNGQAEVLIATGEAKTLEEAIKKISASVLVSQTMETLITDTFEDLLYANNKMKRETVKMVRAVVAEQMKMKVAENMGRKTIRDAVVKALTKKELAERFNVEGNVAIIDKAGRRWKLETYAEMVTRTKLLQAHTEGTRIESLERGIDLAIISSHGATDACRGFEGQVISLNGYTNGFMTYEELRRSNLIFHPNCKHKVTTIRDVSVLPPEVREKFERGRADAENALREIKKK